MVTRKELKIWLVDALKANNNQGSIPNLSKWIWDHHKDALEASEALFYTWQYDLRWAAKILRTEGIMKPAKASPKGIWELNA